MTEIVPKIKIPPFRMLTAAELAERQRVIGDILRQRAELPPLGLDSAQLIRELREGDGAR